MGSAALTASAAGMQAAEGRSGNTATCRRAAETGTAAGTGIGGTGTARQTVGDGKMIGTAAAGSMGVAGIAVRSAAAGIRATAGTRTGEESGNGTVEQCSSEHKLGCAVQNS